MRYVGQLENVCPLIGWKLTIDGISRFNLATRSPNFPSVHERHATHPVSFGSTDKTSLSKPEYVQSGTLDWTLSLMIGTHREMKSRTADSTSSDRFTGHERRHLPFQTWDTRTLSARVDFATDGVRSDDTGW
jgi:hypothetical protein